MGPIGPWEGFQKSSKPLNLGGAGRGVTLRKIDFGGFLVLTFVF